MASTKNNEERSILFVKNVSDGIFNFKAGQVITHNIKQEYLKLNPSDLINTPEGDIDEKTRFFCLQIIIKNAILRK